MTIAAAATDDAAKVAADAAADIENYGAVAAPGWVLPLGAVAVIATALLPIYLKSGGDASKQMQDRGNIRTYIFIYIYTYTLLRSKLIPFGL
jgi:hypothetical protein